MTVLRNSVPKASLGGLLKIQVQDLIDCVIIMALVRLPEPFCEALYARGLLISWYPGYQEDYSNIPYIRWCLE